MRMDELSAGAGVLSVDEAVMEKPCATGEGVLLLLLFSTGQWPGDDPKSFSIAPT
jgi:hypothetical protein